MALRDLLERVSRGFALPGLAAALALLWIGGALGFDAYGPSADEVRFHIGAQQHWRWILDGPSFAADELLAHFGRPTATVPPILSRWLSGLGWVLLGQPTGHGEGVSLRLYSAVAYAVLFALVVVTARRRYGALGALAAVPLFFSLARLAGHAHLATPEVLHAALWFATSVTAATAELPSRRRTAAVALLAGLALATHLAAFVLIGIVAMFWTLAFRGRGLGRGAAVVAGAALVFLALHPSAWGSPLSWTADYLASVPDVWRGALSVPVYAFDHRYLEQPMWAPLVSALLTMSPLALLLAGFGVVVRAARARAEGLSLSAALTRPGALLVASGLSLFVLESLPGVPSYDLGRLFLPLYPFVALWAAGGVEAGRRVLEDAGRLSSPSARAAAGVVVGAALLVPAVETVRLHPNELDYASPLFGGERYAHEVGFDIVLYKNQLTTGVLKEISKKLAPNDTLYAGYLEEDLRVAQRFGRLRTDVTVVGLTDLRADPPPMIDWVLLHARRGFFLAPFEAELYGERPAEWALLHRGVRVLELHRIAAVER